MKTLQAPPQNYPAALERAKLFQCHAIAWTLDADVSLLAAAIAAAGSVGLESHGWLQVARDPDAVAQHPEWMHCPQHHEWLRRYPGIQVGHPALVAPYIGLNTQAAFDHALERTTRLVQNAHGVTQVWLADIQGPPMGCGCGNPSCRSWDNAPGPKVATTPYNHPEVLFPLEFYNALKTALPAMPLLPVLCAECERGVTIDGIEDPDGPEGTNLCQGIPCVRPCALDYWPRLLAAFRACAPALGLLLLADALEKNHPVFGPPRAWPLHAHRHYGTDLIPCVELPDADTFADALLVTDAPQNCWPVTPPPGYRAEVPPIMCGYCPPSSEIPS